MIWKEIDAARRILINQIQEEVEAGEVALLEEVVTLFLSGLNDEEFRNFTGIREGDIE